MANVDGAEQALMEDGHSYFTALHLCLLKQTFNHFFNCSKAKP